MSAPKDRKCETCGKIEFTASGAKNCAECYIAGKSRLKRLLEQQFIEDMGYTNVSLNGYSAQGKPKWQFTHDCGETQSWTFNNLLARSKADPDSIPCSKCGGKRRMAFAMAAFVAKYGITEAQMVEYERYCKKVRTLSDKVYKENITEINPLGLKRGQRSEDYHLDHIMAIIEGFVQGLTPEFMARKENLQMLLAKDNLSKGRK